MSECVGPKFAGSGSIFFPRRVLYYGERVSTTESEFVLARKGLY